MQSPMTNHYLPEEFHENFVVNDDDDPHRSFSQSKLNSIDREEKNHSSVKKSSLTGLEIKGNVRTLSPVLFYQTNTRYLMMSHNELKCLPPEIGNLNNLVYLDLSYNRLKTLPSQIGDLIHLQRLYLEANFLKNLPYELGKLNIEELGLSNNPLGDQILSLFARPNGTREVMNYLREKWLIMCSYSKISPYKTSLSWEDSETDVKKFI